jgi:hypothetical protein
MECCLKLTKATNHTFNIWEITMSDNKKESIQNKIGNIYSGASKELKRSIGGSTATLPEYEDFAKLLRSKDGLSQDEAGILLHGSVENKKDNDHTGSKTRSKIRSVWRNDLNPETEVSVCHSNSDKGKVYFIVSVENYKYWYNEYSKFGCSFDTEKNNRNNPETVKKCKSSINS